MKDIVGKTKLAKMMIAKDSILSALPNKTPEEKQAQINEAKKIIDILIDSIADALSCDDKIILENFMIFETIERGERKSKDFNTGDEITYPPVKSINCRFSKSFRDFINKR